MSQQSASRFLHSKGCLWALAVSFAVIQNTIAAFACALALSTSDFENSIGGAAQRPHRTFMTQIDDSNILLRDALANALNIVNEMRRANRSTMIDITSTFLIFNIFSQISPYISFFSNINVPVIRDNLNRRHYVAFELSHAKLWSMGYVGFFPGDRLVIVLTTSSENSTEITSFKVTLLNTDQF